MSTFDLSDFGEKITAMVDGNCPAELECGPADRWHEDVRDEIMSRISVVDVEDAEDAISRLEEWRDSLDCGDLANGIYAEIVYSLDCEDFVREYENECDEAVSSIYGDYTSFVMSISPGSFTHLIDSLANVGIEYVFRDQVYEWSTNLYSEIEDLIAEIESAIDDDDDDDDDN